MSSRVTGQMPIMFSKGIVAVVVVVHPIIWKLVLVSKGVFVDCMCRHGDERPTGVWYWIPSLARSGRISDGGLSAVDCMYFWHSRGSLYLTHVFIVGLLGSSFVCGIGDEWMELMRTLPGGSNYGSTVNDCLSLNDMIMIGMRMGSGWSVDNKYNSLWKDLFCSSN